MLVIGVVLPLAAIDKFPGHRPHRERIIAEVVMKLDQPRKYDSGRIQYRCPCKISRWRSGTVSHCGNGLTINVDCACLEHGRGGIHRDDAPLQYMFHLVLLLPTDQPKGLCRLRGIWPDMVRRFSAPWLLCGLPTRQCASTRESRRAY